jgi:hypothetical protein
MPSITFCIKKKNYSNVLVKGYLGVLSAFVQCTGCLLSTFSCSPLYSNFERGSVSFY